MNGSLYRAYLKHQAVNHPSLLHSDTEGQQVFEMMNIEDVLGSFRTKTKEKGFIMRGINYTYNVQDDGNGRQIVQGGFLIAKFYSSSEGGSDAHLQALDDAERVVDEIIEKIITDSRNGHPLFLHSLDSNQRIDVRPRPNVGDNYAGYLCLFDFQPYFRVCITDPAAPAWIDGGLTPHDL